MTHNNELARPSVGVATVVVKNDKIAIGKDARKGDAMYGVPGGHWENGETLKECAAREVREECGIDVNDVTLISVYDFYRSDKKKSYATIGMKANYVAGDFFDQAEEGRSDWVWIAPEEALKLNLFPADKILIERYLSGVVFE